MKKGEQNHTNKICIHSSMFNIFLFVVFTFSIFVGWQIEINWHRRSVPIRSKFNKIFFFLSIRYASIHRNSIEKLDFFFNFVYRLVQRRRQRIFMVQVSDCFIGTYRSCRLYLQWLIDS